MRAINHALTGAIIGLTVSSPEVALPVAFLSHFVCDAIPHYSSDMPEQQALKSNSFRNGLIADAAACFVLVVVLASTHPKYWFVAAVCAFLAASPDFFWIPRYMAMRNGRSWKPSFFSKFASAIQWFQRPIGAVVEAVWFAAALIILIPLLH